METVNYQCPSCQGPLRFDGATGKLACDYCGSHFSTAEVEAFYAAKQGKADVKAQGSAGNQAGTFEGAKQKAAASKADPVQDFVNRAAWNTAEQDGMLAYNCSSCGAQLLVDATTAVTSCPYCGNPTVMPGTLSDVVKPDLVIPFKVDKKQAIQAMKRHCEGKFLLPREFSDQNHLEHIQGVYVPFWLYDADAQGRATFEGTNSRTFQQGRDTVREQDHYHVSRAGQMSFQRIPVDASSKMPDAHMDAIEPYDYAALEPFAVSYMPGYVAERYDLDSKDSWNRAQKRIQQSTVDALRSTVSGYETVFLTSSNANVTLTRVQCAMLPVWMLHTRYQNKDYLFAVNGQTGKTVGDLPSSGAKAAGLFAAVFVAAFALALSFVSFLG